jgi:hypothetical protein
MPRSRSKLRDLYSELREYGVDVDALKHANPSEDALNVLYSAMRVAGSQRTAVHGPAASINFRHAAT